MNKIKVLDGVHFRDMTTEDAAKFFAESDAEHQGLFFNFLAEDVKTWREPFCFQMCVIATFGNLSDDARKILNSIGEYAYARGDNEQT